LTIEALFVKLTVDVIQTMQKQSTYTVFGYERIELIKERESLNDMQCYNIATIIYLLVNDVLLVCVI